LSGVFFLTGIWRFTVDERADEQGGDRARQGVVGPLG